MHEDGDWEMFWLRQLKVRIDTARCRRNRVETWGGRRRLDLQTRNYQKIKMANFVGRWEDTGERENFEDFASAMSKILWMKILVTRSKMINYRYIM